MPDGYMGKILWVDLSTRKMHDEELDEKLCRDYIGGFGIGSKLIFNRQKAGVDPLGPDNILGMMTGPLTGTPALGGSRYVVVGKSPLTGTWGDANSGGYFGPHLKFAGYDGVFFTGTADRPVYLFIDNGQAEIRDAAYLWGKDSAETEDILKSELGRDTEVSCIGPSGEKLSLIACIMNQKGRAAGRSGLGAIMGSKLLKAVAVRGNLNPQLADESRAREIRRESLGKLGGPVAAMRQFGTPSIYVNCVMNGDSPIKNWTGVQEIDFPQALVLDANHVVALEEKKYACYQCPVGCGGHMKAGTEYKYPAGVHKPEYESLGMFGTNLLVDNLEAITMANDICNRYGLDTISTGGVIGFAMECYEKGIITGKDTDGIELTWGNHQAMVAMTEKLAKREGFGDILADGVKVAAEKIGKGSGQCAMHVHGQEYPAHDSRFNMAWGIAYRMDPTPGRHTRGMGGNCAGLPVPPLDRKVQLGRQPSHKLTMCWANTVQSLGLCSFVNGMYPHVDVFMATIRAVIGWEASVDEFFKTGERIFNMRQAFNIREGLNPLKYEIPDRMVGKPPMTQGKLAGITLDEDAMDREFLTAMDWDLKTAKPSKARLLELGMEDVAQQLYK